MSATATTHPPHRCTTRTSCTTARSSSPTAGTPHGPNPEEVSGMALAAMLDLVPDSDLPVTRSAATDLPCRSNDAELWFAESPSDVELAKALCGECPLRARCLEGALERREPWGVWGGELVIAGVVVPRKRPRGRPRKEAA